jgi:septum site-determining protein MinC
MRATRGQAVNKNPKPRRRPVSQVPLRVRRKPTADAVSEALPPPVDQAPVSSSSTPTCLFVDASVRSGQTIEFMAGDVTVLGSVGSGAEIVAGGSIHVYGALRGRALAGVGGNPGARILCQKFEAELVSIDGRYRIADNLDPALRGHPVQARLEGPRMTLSRLD